jgi:aspartyl-tRNA synthetase
MFKYLGLQKKQSTIWLLMDAFQFGAPPQRFSFGLDRLVAIRRTRNH